MVVTVLQRRIVKKRIKNFSASNWRWSPQNLQWERRLSLSEDFWVSDHPPLPDWFIEAGGQISDSVFLELLASTATLEELHQQLFWMSQDELSAMVKAHSQDTVFVEGTIDPSDTRSDDVVSTEDVMLVDSEPSAGYDPMRALLAAQESRPFNPQRQFETLEGGRFQAKH